MMPTSRRAILASLALSWTVLSGCVGSHSMARREVAVTETATPGVSWMGPDLNDDRASLNSWRRSVGPPVVIAAPPAPTAASSDRLVVVNWNMHVGGGDIERLFADVRREAGPALPVVLLLQEAYREGPE